MEGSKLQEGKRGWFVEVETLERWGGGLQLLGTDLSEAFPAAAECQWEEKEEKLSGLQGESQGGQFQ